MKFIPTTIPDLRPLVLQDLHRCDERDSPHSYELGWPLQGSAQSNIQSHFWPGGDEKSPNLARLLTEIIITIPAHES